jgi:hypothetical protein
MTGGLRYKKKKTQKNVETDPKVAPIVDPEESFGEEATLSDIATGDSTPVV